MITVLLSTYNGETTLPRMLSALRRLTPPPGGWKLVVVDNGSTDRTRDVIRRYATRLPLTHVYEARRGKNAALNAGLPHVEGDLVVFTDDDIVAGEDWLLHLYAAARAHPDYTVFGGTVLPLWESKPDAWIVQSVSPTAVYALTSAAWQEGPIEPKNVFGPNLAIRSEVFQAGHRFNEAVGPDGTATYVMGSETDLVARLAGEGHRTWFAPFAVVHHVIRRHQMKMSWILQRGFRFGRHTYRVRVRKKTGNVLSFFGYPIYLVVLIALAALKAGGASLVGSQQDRFRALWNLRYRMGQAHESKIIHAEQPRPTPFGLISHPPRLW